MAGLAIACLQISSFIFGLPWLQMGIWLQVEPMMLAHYAISALALIWVWLAARRNIIQLPSHHPLWWVLIAWLAWQVISVLFSPSPWRAWLGAANTGEGTGWWLALSAQTLLIAVLWPQPLCRRWLFAAASLTLLYLSAVHAIWYDENMIKENNNPWLPNPWPDYMAFMVGFLWVALLVSKEAHRQRMLVLTIALGLATLLSSHNTTGIALLSLAICLSILYHASPWLQQWLKPSASWRIAACLSCLLPIGWYGYSFYYEHSNELGYAGQASFLAAKDEGMGSRLVLNQVAISSLMHEPSRLLLSHGFGSFSDDLLKYGLVDGLATFRGEERRPNWFLLDGTSHHSHSQPLEALLSFGLVGLVLWLAVPITMLLTLPASSFWRCAPLISALTALSYVWFQIPHVIGFHALAMGAIIGQCTQRKTPRSRRSIRDLWLPAGALVLIISAWMQWQMIRYAEQLMGAINTLRCDTLTQDFIMQDLPRGGMHLNETAIKFILSAVRYGKDAPPAVSTCYEKLFDASMASWNTPATGGLIRVLSLNMHYELFLSLPSPIFDGLRKTAYQTIEEMSIRFTRYAPLRDDKITPFLMNLENYSKGSDAVTFRVLDQILIAAPNHRPALWLMGEFLMKDPNSRSAGMEMKKEAVRAHVERVFPISEKELRDIQKP